MNLPQADREFEALLNYLKHNRGCDLTGYKRSTLQRRFTHRMQSLNIFNYPEYLQYIQKHYEEWFTLLNDVLINVTSFFRDRDAWVNLTNNIIPKIIASKQPSESIRVWSAGCASGEEVYSLMILFAEALGIDACLQRVQHYATDMDEDAIKQARFATYSSIQVAAIPPELLEKYFKQTPQGYIFHQKLRDTIVFGHHNLVQDAPMSKIDLLTCRNVLIYFDAETQASILIRFHFALKDRGFLFLGKAESLVTRRQIFTPVDLKHQVYIKGFPLELPDHLLIMSKSLKKQALEATKIQTQIWQTAYDTSPFAQLAVDLNDCLIAANIQAKNLFGLTLDDWNRPLQELEPGKLLGDRASVELFYGDRRPTTLKNIEWTASKMITYLDVSIVPIFNQKQHLIGINLMFIDVSDRQQLAKQLDTVRQKTQLFESNEHYTT